MKTVKLLTSVLVGGIFKLTHPLCTSFSLEMENCLNAFIALMHVNLAIPTSCVGKQIRILLCFVFCLTILLFFSPYFVSAVIRGWLVRKCSGNIGLLNWGDKKVSVINCFSFIILNPIYCFCNFQLDNYSDMPHCCASVVLKT